MKKSFSARRVPRKVGQDDEDASPASTADEQSSGKSKSLSPNPRLALTPPISPRSLTTSTESTLQRPSAKPRKTSSLRKSYGPTAVEDEDEAEPAGVVTPKRGGLSRIAVQRNASKRASLLASSLPVRPDDEDDDRPSYSAASLRELKNSTPKTPGDLTTEPNSDVDDVEKSTQALDLSSKFGNSLSRYQQPSAIPSAAEIEEKKARRSRLAKEQAAEEFISLDPDDPDLDEDLDDNVTRDDVGRLILKPKDKYNNAESRLVRDDEDVLENFEEFTEADGKILLGRKAEAEAARKRKADMAARIAEAEGSHSDSDSDTSEKERNEAFEAAQTRHGTYAENSTSIDPYADMRPRTPPKISPLPTLDGALERLRKQVVEMQTSRMQKLREMDALQKEKVRLGEEEVRIQRQLKETGEWYAKFRAEKGLEESVQTGQGLLEGGMGGAGAGLGFSSGSTVLQDPDGGRAGLGLGMSSRGLDSLGSSAAATPDARKGSGDDDGMVT